MAYRLFAIAEAWTGRPINRWVRSCDVNAHNGRGAAVFTVDRAEAMPFLDLRAALDYWKRPSDVAPLRPDGKPNRPLTAYTVQPVADDAEPSRA